MRIRIKEKDRKEQSLEGVTRILFEEKNSINNRRTLNIKSENGKTERYMAVQENNIGYIEIGKERNKLIEFLACLVMAMFVFYACMGVVEMHGLKEGVMVLIVMLVMLICLVDRL